MDNNMNWTDNQTMAQNDVTEIRTYGKSYEEYKNELDIELNKASESFVRIGYLLKVARDTDVLANSPYDNVVDFARAEYSIDKTQVSRFIHINDRFSEGGYSDHLLPGYRGFGYAKLTLMLQLPESINEELTPDYSKAEIQAIKDEIDEENKVTDIERLLEEESHTPGALDTPLGKAIAQLGEDEPELYVEIAKAVREEFAEVDVIDNERAAKRVLDTMAPSGERVYSIRVMGTGRVMLMLSDASDVVRLINSRTGEKVMYKLSELVNSWDALMDYRLAPEAAWEKLYAMKFPRQEPEVAPVQPSKQDNKTETKPVKKDAKKESKVKKAKPERSSVQENKPEPVVVPEPMKEDVEEEEVAEAELVAAEPEIVEDEVVEGDIEPTKHQIRISSLFFDDVCAEKKSFELRKNDRGYKQGDILEMMEFIDGRYTGRQVNVHVTYILEDYEGLEPGYCIMAIRRMQ